MLLRRYGTYVLVTGSTRLRGDDVLLLLADDAALQELERRGELVGEPALSLCEYERPA